MRKMDLRGSLETSFPQLFQSWKWTVFSIDEIFPPFVVEPPNRKEAMLRAVLISPVFSSASEIDSIRSIHDPLGSKIRPHITLVFPFESALSAEDLAAHAREAVASIGCFPVCLGRPQTRGGGFIWLPVMQGRNDVMALHDALYRGPLGIHLDSARPYEPHLTIARAQVSGFERAHQLALVLRGPFEAYVDRVIVELIMSDENSSVESVIDLQKKEPNQTLEPTALSDHGSS